MNPINQLKERVLSKKKDHERTDLTQFIDVARELGCIGDFLGRDFEVRDAKGELIYAITQKPIYRKAMGRIESYLKDAWNDEGQYFYQGMHFTDGQWIPNTDYFATDVQTWGIAKLGPKMIDDWFGEGAAFRMWKKTKELSGSRKENNRLLGVGFSEENNRISIEWTAGAIYAANALDKYYLNSHPDWSDIAFQDAITMRQGIDAYRFDLSPEKAAYSYSSRRDWIPFGWFSHDMNVMSLVSTCWVILLDMQFNPFYLSK